MFRSCDASRLPIAFILVVGLDLAASLLVGAGEPPDWNPEHETGRPFVQAYSHRDYNGHSQVFTSAQDSRGVLYAANSRGVLEYDGARWRRIIVRGTTFLYGLSIARDDVIYDFWTGSRYFVQGMGRGLYRLEGDSLNLVSDDRVFRSEALCGMIDWGGDSVLLATKRDGLYTFGPQGLARFTTEVDAFIREQVMNKLVRLSSGSLALGTFNGGVAIVDTEGRFIRMLDESTGLPNQTIVHMTEDREGGLWCSLGSGIARVGLRSPITLFDQSNGLRSVLVWCMKRHDGVFHLGTNSGLYRLLRPEALPGRARFELVPGMLGEVVAMLDFPEGLLTGLNQEVKFLAEGESTTVASYDMLVYSLVRSTRDPTRVFVGHNGLGSLRLVDGEWVDEGVLHGCQAQVRSIVEEDRPGAVQPRGQCG